MQPMLHFFFFNDTATTEIYTLSLHDALPIYRARTTEVHLRELVGQHQARVAELQLGVTDPSVGLRHAKRLDRKSTRLNSSHSQISYAVFCLKKKKKEQLSNSPDSSLRPRRRD